MTVRELTTIELNCLRSLAFPHMDDRSHDVENAASGTFTWLLEHDIYKSWVTAPQGGLLWIKGKPGSGKSTLLKYALSQHPMGDGGLVLSFFFHGRGDSLQKSPIGLLRSLLHQLLRKVPDALKGLVAAYEEKCRTLGPYEQRWHWNEKELQGFLGSALPKVLEFSGIWLYIDALDECGEGDAVKLIKWLESVMEKTQRQASQHQEPLRLCFSCRYYPVFTTDATSEIRLEELNGDDIKTFVDSQFDSLQYIPSTIPKKITKNAAGIFIWARLVVEKILELDRQGRSPKYLERAVESIPPDLDSMYQQLTHDMSPMSVKLIQWVCFAVYLDLKQLRWALVIEPDSPYQSLHEYQEDEEYIADDERMLRYIRALSCGLVEVTKYGAVQFIHESVKEFFLAKGLALLDGNVSEREAAARANMRLAKICCRYLDIAQNDLPAAFQDGRARINAFHRDDMACTGADYLNGRGPLFGFLYYASFFLFHHLRQCDPSDGACESFVEFYFQGTNNRRWPHWIGGEDLLHWCARRNMPQLLAAALRKADEYDIDINSNSPKDERTPLILAVVHGRQNIAKLLVETGKVDINALDLFGRAALHYAARDRQADIVKLLLETGKADVNISEKSCYTPIFYAVRAPDYNIVKMLLDTGAVDTNPPNAAPDTLLHSASGVESPDLVRLLILETGKASVNVQDRNGDTPLHLAAQGKYPDSPEAVRLLLATGQADVNIQNNLGQTPLHCAAKLGDGDVVELLLERPDVGLNIPDSEGQTPLLTAADFCNEQVVQLLLSHDGVDLNHRDSKGRTLFWTAAKSGASRIIKLFLDTDKVDITQPDIKGRTPLFIALERGREEVVRMLLDLDSAEDQIIDAKGRTPLLVAAKNNGCVGVKYLVRSQMVDAGAMDEKGRTAFDIALARGHLRVVELFLAAGMINHDKIDHKRTLLLATMCLGKTESGYRINYSSWTRIVSLLLQMGKVDAADLGRALLIAIEQQSYRPIRFLLRTAEIDEAFLERGLYLTTSTWFRDTRAVVKQLLRTGKIGTFAINTALLRVAQMNHHFVHRTLGVLVDTGKVDMASSGREALALALKYRNLETAKMFLERGAPIDEATVNDAVYWAASEGDVEFVIDLFDMVLKVYVKDFEEWRLYKLTDEERWDTTKLMEATRPIHEESCLGNGDGAQGKEEQVGLDEGMEDSHDGSRYSGEYARGNENELMVDDDSFSCPECYRDYELERDMEELERDLILDDLSDIEKSAYEVDSEFEDTWSDGSWDDDDYA
jgi:ankyrin repeat protein